MPSESPGQVLVKLPCVPRQIGAYGREFLRRYFPAMPITATRVNDDPRDGDRVFILRFWIERESGPQAVPFWRAKVSDVVSGEEKHVNGVEAALDHVRKSMNRTAG